MQFRSNLIKLCLRIPYGFLTIELIVTLHHGNPNKEQPANHYDE
ncbi:MAG: hypothetical protein NTU79_00520 [Planctomycetota bacterium]|nr:hypothetical protein [Planctomycetota bacterium]